MRWEVTSTAFAAALCDSIAARGCASRMLGRSTGSHADADRRMSPMASEDPASAPAAGEGDAEPAGPAHPLDPARHRPLDLRSTTGPALLVATRKGAFILKADDARRTWKLEGPIFLGHIVQHLVVDPRDRRPEVEADGTTVEELLEDLERRYPGIRFRMIDEQDRIRPHIRIFVNRERIRALDVRLGPSDEVQILQALSGG
jgi:molybdopterin converting factor small subunit